EVKGENFPLTLILHFPHIPFPPQGKSTLIPALFIASLRGVLIEV
ncbi:unnamed protein product, partial [marine sediment metagenome]